MIDSVGVKHCEGEFSTVQQEVEVKYVYGMRGLKFRVWQYSVLEPGRQGLDAVVFSRQDRVQMLPFLTHYLILKFKD